MVSLSVTVSAECICQFGFRFRYWTETKIVVSVVHYYTGSKNPVRNRLKIQFVKLDFSKLIFQKSTTDQQRESHCSVEYAVPATKNIQGRPRVYIRIIYSSGLHLIVMTKGNQFKDGSHRRPNPG